MPVIQYRYMEKTNISPFEQWVIDKVRAMRIERGLSQRQLATIIDITSGFIGKVESTNERAKYNLDHLNMIAKAFECSPRDLLPAEPI